MNRFILGLVFIALMLNFSLLLNFLLKKRIRLIARLEQVERIGSTETEEFQVDPSILIGKNIKAGKYQSDLINQFFGKIKQSLSQADILMKPEEFFFMSIGIGLVLFLLIYLVSKIAFIAVIAGIIGYLLPRIYVNLKKEQRGAAIHKQLPEALDLISSGLRAGLSFAQSMNLASNDMEEPIRSEFEKVIRDNTLGKSMEEALLGLVDRTKDDNIDLFVTAMIVQRQIGGNLSEVLEIISNTLRERVRVQGEIRTLTAQSRISAVVVGLLPPGLAIVLSVMNPEYMRELFSSPVGIIMVIIATVMNLLGIFILMRMTKVEV